MGRDLLDRVVQQKENEVLALYTFQPRKEMSGEM